MNGSARGVTPRDRHLPVSASAAGVRRRTPASASTVIEVSAASARRMNERRQDSRRKIHRRGKRSGDPARRRQGDRRRRHRRHQAQSVARMMVVRREIVLARSLRGRLLFACHLLVVIVRPGDAAECDQRAAIRQKLQVPRSSGNGQHRCDARLHDEHQAQQQPKIPFRHLHSARASRVRQNVAIAGNRSADHRQARPRPMSRPRAIGAMAVSGCQLSKNFRRSCSPCNAYMLAGVSAAVGLSDGKAPVQSAYAKVSANRRARVSLNLDHISV